MFDELDEMSKGQKLYNYECKACGFEKGEDGCSDLYSLVEFKGLRKIKSFQKSYRNGAFGAVPNI